MPRRYENRTSPYTAWYVHGGDAMGGTRIAMISPQTPDCRGGVFAVFAKIPPPVAHPPPPPRAFPCSPLPAHRPRHANPPRLVPSTIRRHGSPAYGASRFARRPVPTGHAGYSPSRALAARYLRGVERGIATLQTTPPPSATRHATSLLRPTVATNQSQSTTKTIPTWP